MGYFRLAPDVILQVGARAGALYAVGRKAVLPLSPDEANILRQSEQGTPLDLIDASPDLVANLVMRLETQSLGRQYGRPVVVDRYLHSHRAHIRSFYDAPLTLSAVYIQLTSGCDLRCRDCHPSSSAVWQGCNACQPWPGVDARCRWSPDALADVVGQLAPLRLGHVYASGGNPLTEEALLRHLIERLGESRYPPQFVITTPGVGLSREFARWAAARKVAFNFVLLGPDRDSYVRACGSPDAYTDACNAIDICGSVPVKYFLTLRLSAAVEITLEAWQNRARTLGAAGVILCHTMRQGDTAMEARPAVGPLPATDHRRVPQVGPEEMHRRQYWNCCLDRAVAIAADRRLRVCPMIDDCLGDLAVEPLRRVFAERRVDRYWNLTKDGIEGCRQCEFRYACVDCTAIDLQRAWTPAARNPLCDYDPMQVAWRPADRSQP